MNWRPFVILLSFVLAALIVGLLGWLTQSLELKLAAAATGLALIAVGLGVNSFMISRHTDRRMKEMNVTLTQIVDLQEEMHKEQKEQSSSGSTIVPTLQAFSQIYLDYLAKQKNEEEQQNDRNNEEISKEISNDQS